jgi:hypothetical protein
LTWLTTLEDFTASICILTPETRGDILIEVGRWVDVCMIAHGTYFEKH